jgi:tellurite resistance protein
MVDINTKRIAVMKAIRLLKSQPELINDPDSVSFLDELLKVQPQLQARISERIADAQQRMKDAYKLPPKEREVALVELIYDMMALGESILGKDYRA